MAHHRSISIIAKKIFDKLLALIFSKLPKTFQTPEKKQTLLFRYDWINMKFIMKMKVLGFCLLLASCASLDDLLGDLNCGLNSLLGGSACEIQKINELQERKRAEWMRGDITATEAVRAIVEYHQSLLPIDSYNKELYLYYVQVARVCDAGRITKEQGLYLMTKKENEIGERIQARQPPVHRPLTCTSERQGSRIVTNCL